MELTREKKHEPEQEKQEEDSASKSDSLKVKEIRTADVKKRESNAERDSLSDKSDEENDEGL